MASQGSYKTDTLVNYSPLMKSYHKNTLWFQAKITKKYASESVSQTHKSVVTPAIKDDISYNLMRQLFFDHENQGGTMVQTYMTNDFSLEI